jgi:hypothetical protein
MYTKLTVTMIKLGALGPATTLSVASGFRDPFVFAVHPADKAKVGASKKYVVDCQVCVHIKVVYIFNICVFFSIFSFQEIK